MIQFSIGVSALQAAQQGLALAGNNLANASTPGYHRQIAQFSALSPTQYYGQSIGTGVEMSDINRIVSEQLETALTQQYGVNAFTDTSIQIGSQLEQTIGSGSTSPSSQLEQLLNQIQALSGNPTNPAGLQSTITSAQREWPAHSIRRRRIFRNSRRESISRFERRLIKSTSIRSRSRI